jgi:hypothetical protein
VPPLGHGQLLLPPTFPPTTVVLRLSNSISVIASYPLKGFQKMHPCSMVTRVKPERSSLCPSTVSHLWQSGPEAQRVSLQAPPNALLTSQASI